MPYATMTMCMCKDMELDTCYENWNMMVGHLNES